MIQNYKVSFSIRSAVFLAGGGADTWMIYAKLPTVLIYTRYKVIKMYQRSAHYNFSKRWGMVKEGVL